MEKIEILQNIEHIADKSEDDQVRLNALSYLLNRIEFKEKELQIKQDSEEFSKKTKEQLANLFKSFT